MSGFPDSTPFHVSLLGNGDKPVQEGSLEASPTSLVYSEEGSQVRHVWYLKHLQKFELKGETQLVMEARKPSLITGVFKFSTPQANHIHATVSHSLNALGLTSLTTPTHIPPNPSSPKHWRLNTSLSSDSTNQSPVHSRSSSLGGVFEIERMLPDLKTTERGTLEIANGNVIYTEGVTGRVLNWPIEYLRRFGCEANVFTVETGRRCLGGPKLYNFRTPRAGEISAAIKMLGSAERHSTSMSPSPTDKLQTPPPHHPSTPVFVTPPRRGPLPPPPKQPPLPLPPSQPPLPPPPSQPPLPLPPIGQSRTPTHVPNHAAPSPFKRTDSYLRRAFSAMDIRKDVFEVRNISDDRLEVGQGTVEVTATDLVYVDSRTNEKWKWPYKYLRKYGFEGKIFTFEAGRRCPGGQGLYAFASERASEIHEAMVENIHGKKSLAPSEKTSDNSRSNPRLSLTGETLASPPIQLSNRNQYDIHTSPKAAQKFTSQDRSAKPQVTRSGSPATSAVTPLATSTSVPATTTNEATPIASKAMPITNGATASVTENTQSPLSSSTATSSSPPPLDPSPSNSAHMTDSMKSITPSVSTSEEGDLSPTSPASQNPAKPVLEPTKPAHLYDVPNYFREQRLKVAESSKNGGEKSATSVGTGVTTGAKHPAKKGSKVKRTRSTTQENPAEPSLVIAKDGGRGSVGTKGGKKDKQNMIGWLMSRKGRGEEEKAESSRRTKSGKKKKGSKHGKHTSAEPSLSDETDEFPSNSMYENLSVMKLRKTAFSASCDNILEMIDSSPSSIPQPRPEDSYNSGSSSVPQPKLRSESPALSNATPPSGSLTTYQNLQEATAEKEMVEQSSSAQGAPVLVPSDSPSPFYSNIEISDTNLPPEPKQMMYAEVDIIPLPLKSKSPKKSKVQKQSSLTSIGTKPIPTSSPGSNRQRSQSTMGSASQKDPKKADTGGDGGVVYASLDVVATQAVAQMREDHQDVSNFEGLLKRHDLRKMEMDGKR